MVPRVVSRGCTEKSPWQENGNTAEHKVLAFVASDKALKFSELHPVKGLNTPGIVRLMGLSAHSCDDARKDFSPCLVDVEFDIEAQTFRGEAARPAMYRIRTTKAPQQGRLGYGNDLETVESKDLTAAAANDRYRNFVGPPFVVSHDTQPSLIWLWRGAIGKGEDYDTSATVRRYAIGATREDVAVDLGELHLSDFQEKWEPSFIANAGSLRPTFLSFLKSGSGFNLFGKMAVPPGEDSPTSQLDCLHNLDSSWLHDLQQWYRTGTNQPDLI